MRCKYIRKIFQNEENGYTVALFSTLNQEVPLSARDKFWAEKKIIAFTAKGYDLPLTDEIEIEMEGEWETSSYGTQYKVETFLEVVPRTREGILGYLSCGSLKGIGPKTAERIVNRFGLDTLEVMEKYPQELLKIQGISQKKLDRIVDSFGKNKVFRELMTFLSPFHVTPKKANMILQKFRDQSVEIIRKQPYILCSVKGFGFLTVDAIARQCCAATNDPMRISGCVSYVLREAMKQNGHLYLEQEILVKDALKVLNKELNLQPVTETEILKVLYRLVMQDSIVVEENRVYITQQHQEEEDTASMIARKLHERIPVLTIEKELEEAQEDLNITLSEQQKEAVRMVFANPISIITGGPGTGKTTVLKIILYIYQKKCGNEVKLMAPTGRAARRMAESTGSGDATTMHMALGLFGDGDYEALIDELSADFINVDEVSMVDMHLAYEFFYKVKAGARVLLVGDVHQLPSVGAGDVFRQLTQVRKDGLLNYLRPDGKSQVTVEYDEAGIPHRLDAVVLSTQHDPDVTQEQIHDDIKKYVLEPIIPTELVDENTKFFINPTGRFVIGGPHGDSGVTGRKIIVDTYGGMARHGGGAFSGKDCTKVDRSASYAARYVAKNIVAAGLAKKCEIQLSYAIGVAHPTSIMVDTFGTGKISDESLVEIIRREFDLRPAGIIQMLDLRRPIYKQTAAYGHFGRDDINLPWERLDRVEELKKYLE